MVAIQSFKQWLEVRSDEDEPLIVPMSSEEIPYDQWGNLEEPIRLFVYGNMISSDQRPLEEFKTARVRGAIRVFDVPTKDGRTAMLSMRKTGRLEDVVNGGITTIPSDSIKELWSKFVGYNLGKIDAVLIDAQTGMPFRKSESVYYLFHPQRVNKKYAPNEEQLRAILKSAYDISSEFGDEFVHTTYRLPKRGNRLVKITR